MKKIIALALALIMVLSMASVAFAKDYGTRVNNAEELAAFLNTQTAGCATVDGDKVTLVKDYSGEGVIINGSVVLDLNGYTFDVSGLGVASSKSRAFAFQLKNYTGTNSVTILNGTIKATGTGIRYLFQNYSDLTLTDVTLDGTDTGKITYAISNSNGNVVLNGNTSIYVVDGTVAFDVWDSTDTDYPNGTTVTVNTTGTIDGDIEVGVDSGSLVELVITEGYFDGEFTVNDADTVSISGGTFTDDVSEYLADGVQLGADGNVYTDAVPGETIVVSTDYARADYKVKSYDFTTGTKGYNGASYIDEIKINKNNELVIVLKDNYKLATDKLVKGEIVLQNKETKAEGVVPVFYTVANNVFEDIPGARKAKDADDYAIDPGANNVYIMDEDGGYVSFQEEMLKGVVKMNAEEKVYLNLIYGGQEETVEAIEELLGEEYLDEAIIEYYEFETRAFKNEVAFSYEAYEDDPHYFYLWNDGKLTKIDAVYNDDEDVEAWEWTAVAEGTIIVTDVEIVLAAEEETKNPDTGANDVVGVAAALAVVSLIAAGAASLKK